MNDHKLISSTDLIVLTGGPGAGKTAVLEFVRKILCDHVVVFPEVAAVIDQKIHEVWKDHPRYQMIASQTDFLQKVHLAVACLKKYVPTSCENDAK